MPNPAADCEDGLIRQPLNELAAALRGRPPLTVVFALVAGSWLASVMVVAWFVMELGFDVFDDPLERL